MPKLILMKGVAATRQFSLLAKQTTIGRASTNDVVLDAMQVSRHHALVTLGDLGSRNGVFVNGVKVRSQVLVGGDEVSIGAFKIRFLSGEQDPSGVDAMRLVSAPE